MLFLNLIVVIKGYNNELSKTVAYMLLLMQNERLFHIYLVVQIM